jgi:hypothetical protein
MPWTSEIVVKPIIHPGTSSSFPLSSRIILSSEGTWYLSFKVEIRTMRVRGEWTIKDELVILTYDGPRENFFDYKHVWMRIDGYTPDKDLPGTVGIASVMAGWSFGPPVGHSKVTVLSLTNGQGYHGAPREDDY